MSIYEEYGALRVNPFSKRACCGGKQTASLKNCLHGEKSSLFNTLQVGMLGKNFSIQHFLIFPRNQIFDTNLHEVSDPNF